VNGQRRPSELPDFAVIGAMKAGTTTLHGWLSQHPAVSVATEKEPDFFSREDVYSRGPSWYAGLFEADRGLRGEASVSYSFPEFASRAAERLVAASPSVKVLYLVRHPLDRVRSHYRHQVLRNRERRTFIEAIKDPGSEYVMRSRYWTCLRPYVDRLHRSQILVVRSEDLFGSSDTAWLEILRFLSVPVTDRPVAHLNGTDQKAQFSRVMRRLWEAGIRRPPRGTPAVVRRLARRALLREDASPLLRTASDPVDASLAAEIWADCAELETWMGSARLWNDSVPLGDDQPIAGSERIGHG
jgi:hypothetical protein